MPAICSICDAFDNYEDCKYRCDFIGDYFDHYRDIENKLENAEDEIFDIMDRINGTTFLSETFAQGLDYEEAKEMILVVHRVAELDCFDDYMQSLRDCTLESLGVCLAGISLISLHSSACLTPSINWKWIFLDYRHSLRCWCARLSYDGC